MERKLNNHKHRVKVFAIGKDGKYRYYRSFDKPFYGLTEKIRKVARIRRHQFVTEFDNYNRRYIKY